MLGGYVFYLDMPIGITSYMGVHKWNRSFKYLIPIYELKGIYQVGELNPNRPRLVAWKSLTRWWKWRGIVTKNLLNEHNSILCVCYNSNLNF